jgi:hypothetical protein
VCVKKKHQFRGPGFGRRLSQFFLPISARGTALPRPLPSRVLPRQGGRPAKIGFNVYDLRQFALFVPHWESLWR